jgi:hypothetical protein
MANLSHLPTEILDLITHHLVTPDLGFRDAGIFNLRLTCRALCLKTQYEFGRAAFSTLRLDLHPKTLERLVTICTRPAFGSAVKKLVFAHWGDEYVSFPQVHDSTGLERLDEQVSYVLSKIFEEAFAHTPNLEEVVIIAPCIARFRRHQLTLQSEFASLEYGKVEDFKVAAEGLYGLVMGAVGATDTHLSRFEITKTETPREKYDVPVMCVSDCALAKTEAARGLKYLEQFKVTVHAIGAGSSFGSALSVMERLTRLELEFIGRMIYRQGWRKPEQRDAVVEAMRSLRNVRFPRLKALVIRNASVDVGALEGFLRLHQGTLRCIGLLGICLVQGHWDDILTLLLDDMAWLNELRTRQLYNGVPHPPWSRMKIEGHSIGRDPVVEGLSNMLGRVYKT